MCTLYREDFRLEYCCQTRLNLSSKWSGAAVVTFAEVDFLFICSEGSLTSLRSGINISILVEVSPKLFAAGMVRTGGVSGGGGRGAEGASRWHCGEESFLTE